MEAQLTAWFATHPFWKVEAISIVSALAPMMIHDYTMFKQAQAEDPNGSAITFDIFVALRRYTMAVFVGVLPPIGAVIYRVLGL